MEAAKLIYYTHAARQRYLKMLAELPWEEFIEDRGASFASMRNIFLHVLDVEDRLINYVIPERSQEWIQQDYLKFTDMSSIEKRAEDVEKKANAYLASLTPRELDRKVTLPWRRNPPLVMRVEDILAMISFEAASHMGELIALLWQDDIQPPFLSWSDFIQQDKQ